MHDPDPDSEVPLNRALIARGKGHAGIHADHSDKTRPFRVPAIGPGRHHRPLPLQVQELATKPITHDSDIAARLWSISEKLCGLTPPQTELLAVQKNQHA